jgi:uncharacterized protein (TIGR00369 family)
MTSADSKLITDSKVTLGVMMGPQDTNGLGNVHGGVIMKIADEAGGLAAMRHSRKPAVTVVIDSMTFMHPVRVGAFVQFNAELTYVGRTSMEVRVEVIAENPLDGTSIITNTAYLVYVALNDDGKPTPVPSLIFETDEQKARAEQAKARQSYRQRQRKSNNDT